MERTRAWVLAVASGIGIAIATSCGGSDCKKFLATHKDDIDELRRNCDCRFSLECKKDDQWRFAEVAHTEPDGAGAAKITIRDDPDHKVDDATLAHEMIHALDLCQGFSASHFPLPDNLKETKAEDAYDLLRKFLAEYIAYTLTGVNPEVLPSPNGAFPNPDGDDRAIGSAFGSVTKNAIGASKTAQDILDQLLGMIGLPRDVKASDEMYQKRKKELQDALAEFRARNGRCIALIQRVHGQ